MEETDKKRKKRMLDIVYATIFTRNLDLTPNKNEDQPENGVLVVLVVVTVLQLSNYWPPYFKKMKRFDAEPVVEQEQE